MDAPSKLYASLDDLERNSVIKDPEALEGRGERVWVVLFDDPMEGVVKVNDEYGLYLEAGDIAALVERDEVSQEWQAKNFTGMKTTVRRRAG